MFKKKFKTLLVGFFGVCSLLTLWAFLIEPAFRHSTKSYELSINDWPVKLNGLRIAVLTDLHVGSPYNGLSKLQKIIELTNEKTPDLILFAGDFVIQGVAGGTFISPDEMTPYLAKLSAPLGVYAVLGNHDYWFDAKAVTSALEKSGIQVLTNASKKIEFNGDHFWLAGLDDSWTGRPDIAGTLSQINDENRVIAFTHNPDLFVEIPKQVTLTIAGHTHGGQVYIPFVGRPIVPSQFGERFAVGHIVEEGRHLFVSQGTGTSIIPVRFLVPPEISILNFSN